MPNIQKINEEYIKHLESLDKRRIKLEKLLNQKSISKKDTEKIYESFFLDSVCNFESFLESLFFYLLTQNSLSNNVKPVIIFPSYTAARRVVLNGKHYLDWLPYDDYTCKLAKIYLNNKGFPFPTIGYRSIDKNKNTIDQFKKEMSDIVIIRNAIAHRSSHSKKKFKNMINYVSLPPREKQPGGFLRSRLSSNQTRFEMYINTLAAIANNLCNKIA